MVFDGVVEFMSLLIFCLLDLSISDRGLLKFPAVIVDSSISPYSSISFCLTYFDALWLGIYMVRTVMQYLIFLSIPGVCICSFGNLMPSSHHPDR